MPAIKGRRPGGLDSSQNRKALTIYLPPEVLGAVQEWAAERGVSASTVGAECVAYALPRIRENKRKRRKPARK